MKGLTSQGVRCGKGHLLRDLEQVHAVTGSVCSTDSTTSDAWGVKTSSSAAPALCYCW